MLKDEGETPKMVVGEEIPVNTEGQEPGGEGLQVIVDLVDEGEGEDSPVDRRESRRQARRSLRDEVDALALSTAVGQEETPGSGEELNEEEERRLAKERKRKGKHAVTPQTKRSRMDSSIEEVEEPIPPPTKVPSPRSQSVPALTANPNLKRMKKKRSLADQGRAGVHEEV